MSSQSNDHRVFGSSSAEMARALLSHGDAELAVSIFPPGEYGDNDDCWAVVLSLGWSDEWIASTGDRDTAKGIALALDAVLECGAYEDGVRL